MDDLKSLIREVPDFPKEGILFYDVTTLLKDVQGLSEVLERLTGPFEGLDIHKVIGIESRGFIFAPTVAQRIGAGFVLVRKPGKLPARTISVPYDLEYGQDELEIHEDAISAGENVLIIDDLIATGGTAAATVELVRRLGGNVIAAAFLVELEFLNGRQKLDGVDVVSILQY